MTPDRRRQGQPQRLVLGAAGVLLVCLLSYGLYLYLDATLAIPKGEDRRPLRIYAADFPLAPGLHIEHARLRARLDRLGYHEVSREIQSPGEYQAGQPFFDIYLHDSADRHVKGFPLRLVLEDNRIMHVQRLPEADEAPPVALEPPLISGMLGSSHQVRKWVLLHSIPSPLVDAILLIEDRRFYQHPGIDAIAVARAAWENLKSGQIVQGGSTITQQLAKNLYYSNQRTVLRKIKESVTALVLESKYSKEEILESYLNEIYLGQVRSVAVYGVGEAAWLYFGKPVQELTLPEAALLAGMIKAPNTYSPIKDPVQAQQRRDFVLHRLTQEAKISEEQFQAAVATPVRVTPLRAGINDAPYFVDYLLSTFEEPPGNGFKIFTTLDIETQRVAEEVLTTGLRQLETHYPSLKRNGKTVQGAIVVLDPKTGAILAMVGGRDYRTSQFNRVVQARRQAGSLLKPLVYLTAFESSLAAREKAITPATLVNDAPISFAGGKAPWSPQNYDGQFRGEVTVRTALEQSLNVPAVRIAQAVGVPMISRLLRDLGIRTPPDENLSLALGTADVSLLDITAAFGALAQGGFFVKPTAIVAMVEQTGEPGLHAVPEGHQAVSPQAAYLVTSLLKGVVERGTAARAKALGLQSLVAGKTGTTDEYRDAWFVGYTPDLVIGVWVGFDDGRPLGLTGAQAALPMWVDLARQIIPPDSPDFSMPPGMVTRKIDPQTGQLATSRCPESADELFIEGTEPTDYCALHGGGGFWDRLKQSFGL